MLTVETYAAALGLSSAEFLRQHDRRESELRALRYSSQAARRGDRAAAHTLRVAAERIAALPSRAPESDAAAILRDALTATAHPTV